MRTNVEMSEIRSRSAEAERLMMEMEEEGWNKGMGERRAKRRGRGGPECSPRRGGWPIDLTYVARPKEF